MHDPHSAVPDTACRNCSTALAGPYCAQCGQHAHESARSVHVLFHDAWHLLTHLDGRLWSTLALLLFKPGRLTHEYFADRRARYIPPFRLYFIISVAFFALASVTTTLSNFTVAKHPMTTAARAELDSELEQPDVPVAVRSTVDEITTARAMTPQLAAQLCGHLAFGWHRVDARLQSVCVRQLTDQGKSMMHAFAGLVPKMMFVFLPLMALIMRPLYHSPARFYVEHLVFFLHLQSALFVAMILKMLLSAAADRLPFLSSIASIIGFVLFWYGVWYIYAAMHRYYGQSRMRTLGKFVAVAIAYLACFGLSLGGTLILSALLT
jgi:hypothetical protein